VHGVTWIWWAILLLNLWTAVMLTLEAVRRRREQSGCRGFFLTRKPDIDLASFYGRLQDKAQHSMKKHRKRGLYGVALEDAVVSDLRDLPS